MTHHPTAWRLTPRQLAEALGGRLPPPGARIGLLGGSFNPAHEAHRELSMAALRRLGLDEVWWLVSPQNPLKPQQGMAQLARRRASAERKASHPAIRVTTLESQLGTIYTAETLAVLKALFPRVRFVWLMGADNLCQIDRWQDWEAIFQSLPVAVFDRPPYSIRATLAKAAQRFAKFRLPEKSAGLLVTTQPPAWVYVHGRKNPLSATRIRAIHPDWPG
ncbi:nicotinate-nucleotide adenylyltransferase [Limibacillus halophilus]|uniref:Probable nicotinate-nucleotide adenylyltransferase n=1 Tax=Limibacillus halophilus TaxID=1579333 RepID=A0A839SUM4_9PROT|nr:nicotinate-nucleotide adenylyltransferase [Limibacillus halophilus]MBB3066517.1 nicotinate-nucleotide adenylyltransferase [Limibacillus halophilus]